MSVACDGCHHHTLDPLPASPPGELLTIPLSPSRVPGPSSKALILLLKLARAAVVLSLNHFCLCLLNWLITSGVTKARSAPPCSQKPAPKKDMGRRNPGLWSRAGGEGPGLAGRRGGGPRAVGERERAGGDCLGYSAAKDSGSCPARICSPGLCLPGMDFLACLVVVIKGSVPGVLLRTDRSLESGSN